MPVYADDGQEEPTYDNPAVFYDDDFIPTAGKVNMAKVAVNLTGLPGQEQVNRSQVIVTKCTGNANVPDPTPDLATIQARITAAQQAILAYDASAEATHQLLIDRDAKLLAMVEGMTLLGASVQSSTGGDPVKILSTGYDVKASAGGSTGPAQGALEPVVILSLKPGNDPGELVLKVRPVANKLAYEAQVTITPNDAASWRQHLLGTRATMTLAALTSGSHVYVRVRTLMAGGVMSPWSDTDAHGTVP
jgi:hypothetical protein